MKGNLTDREFEKFVETPDGKTAVRTNSVPNGLNLSGRITEVSLDDSAWVPLPATPLANRASILVQNKSGNGNVVLWQYDNGAGATVGVQIVDGEAKTADIGPAIIVYGRMLSGAGLVAIDEVS